MRFSCALLPWASLLLVQPRCPPAVGVEPSDTSIDDDELRARRAELSQLQQRRVELEMRADLTAEEIAVRRICDTVALMEPSSLPLGPSADLSPHDVVLSCLVALQENDALELVKQSGVDWAHRYMWEFLDGMSRAKFGSADEFVREAKINFRGMTCSEWFDTEEDTIAVVPATQTRGSICKMVVHVRGPLREGARSEVAGSRGAGQKWYDLEPPKGVAAAASEHVRHRKFLWTLQQERRPPREGFWLISSVLALDDALEELTM
jgi:hypothetical protein